MVSNIKRTAQDVGNISGSASEANARFRAELDRRNSALPHTILSPNNLQQPDTFNFNRVMHTTLGGESRPITAEDLAKFRHLANKLGKKYVGGITARQIIDHSRKEDRDRARKQITMAIPSYAQKNPRNDGLTVRFITNASKLYGASRHHVVVEFGGFQTAVIGADASKVATRKMLKGNVRFDCDCGRHTYWYRYIASIGNYNYGRAESGFPKIRNPNLIGVACKHVLRVMAEIEGGNTVLSFVNRAVEKARANFENGTGLVKVQNSQKDANQVLKKQESRSISRIEDRAERDLHRARMALRQKVNSFAKSGAKPKQIASGTKKAGRLSELQGSNNDAKDALNKLMRQFGLSAEQVKEMLKGK